MVPAAPSAGTVTGYSRGSPCTPGMLAALGLAARGSCKQTKNPEYFRKVFPPPPPFISSPPSLSLPCKQQSCSPVPLSMGPAPQDAPAAAEPSQVVPSANSFFFSFFFLSYICIFFLPLFFSTQCLFPCHTPPPAPPLPLSPPQALGWPRGCEVRGGSGGCGGLCIDALIAHGLRLTSLLPGKQSPWLLALLLQRRL